MHLDKHRNIQNTLFITSYSTGRIILKIYLVIEKALINTNLQSATNLLRFYLKPWYASPDLYYLHKFAFPQTRAYFTNGITFDCVKYCKSIQIWFFLKI